MGQFLFKLSPNYTVEKFPQNKEFYPVKQGCFWGQKFKSAYIIPNPNISAIQCFLAGFMHIRVCMLIIRQKPNDARVKQGNKNKE